jgi:hypothetical protein
MEVAHARSEGRMSREMLYQIHCARRALSNADGCLMRRVKEWTPEDEVALAWLQRNHPETVLH